MTQQVAPLSPTSPEPYISVIIPVYNEEENLRELGERLMRTLTAMGRTFEIILVDDGSSDRSWEILTELHDKYPQNLRALQFNRNFGQHQAIFAGFQAARGQVMVTLDADLQNPPEEIPRLVAKLEEGYDTVGGWRENRRDSIFRKLPSHLVNVVMSKVTGVHLRDYGCMLRAYRREVIDSINQCNESSSFIPALANLYSRKVAEIPVGHAERQRGQSKYSLIQAHPPQFRPGDRLFQPAHPRRGLHGGGHRLFGAALRRSPVPAPPLRGAGSGGGLYPVRHPVRLRGPQYPGPGPHRRIRRPHLPGGPGPAALCHPADPGAGAGPEMLRNPGGYP